MGNLNILNECSLFGPSQIKIIEDKYKAKYVFESPLKNGYGGWTSISTAVFYTETPHPQGSNYFAIYYKDGKVMITNAISAIEDFSGLKIGNDVIYSRSNHDFREHNGYFVDGGRDYMRYGGGDLDKVKVVGLRVNKDKIEVIEE